jgi:hypothetical protein
MQTIEERFWAKVNKTDECWEWTAAIGRDGYGVFKVDGKMVKAHRYSAILDGRDPTGLLVCHHCDNRKCVRPGHLFLGTNSDNMRDMRAKGRANDVLGIPSLDRKLSSIEVKDIRVSSLSMRKLAQQYGVGYTVINKIKHNKTYKEIV